MGENVGGENVGGENVEVRYFAAAADAAGIASETIELPAGATIGDLVTELTARHGDRLATVLRVAAYLVGDDLVRDRAHPVGKRIDVLPPFAGG